MTSRSMRGAGLALLGLLLLAAIVGLAWFVRYQPDRARYPVRGIDVSHHQKIIDWSAVARDDVMFAYVKATEGAEYRDPLFGRNWRGARRAGLAVGAYHVFSLCRSGRDQAANFLGVVPPASGSLPPAVDLEFGPHCRLRPDGAAFRGELDAFLSLVEGHEGQPAIFYMTPEFAALYEQSLPDRPIWRRAIGRRPDGGRPWMFWQYHNRGVVAGVAHAVDLNVFHDDRAALARLLSPAATPRRADKAM